MQRGRADEADKKWQGRCGSILYTQGFKNPYDDRADPMEHKTQLPMQTKGNIMTCALRFVTDAVNTTTTTLCLPARAPRRSSLPWFCGLLEEPVKLIQRSINTSRMNKHTMETKKIKLPMHLLKRQRSCYVHMDDRTWTINTTKKSDESKEAWKEWLIWLVANSWAWRCALNETSFACFIKRVASRIWSCAEATRSLSRCRASAVFSRRLCFLIWFCVRGSCEWSKQMQPIQSKYTIITLPKKTKVAQTRAAKPNQYKTCEGCNRGSY